MPSLRHALRSLAKTPGFTATAIATIALCLGANLTIYAVVDAILLRPLPFPEPERLVTVFNAYPGAGVERSSASIPNYFERRGAIPAFASLAIHADASFIVGDAGSPERVRAARVSPEFFATLDTPLALGRPFTDAELTYQTDQVAILTDNFWRQHFNADPTILGRTFLNDGLTVTVVGVLPPAFRFLSRQAEFFRPASHSVDQRESKNRHSNNWSMVARLTPGATLTTAQAQIDAFNAQQLVTDPLAQLIKGAGFRTTVSLLHADHVREIRPTLVLLQAGVFFLLIIGVVNLANLLLIRASGRIKDLAIRQALGASRRQVAIEVLGETTLIALAGGLLGLFLGSLGIDILRTLGTERLPMGAQIVFDGRHAIAGLGASLVLAVVLAVPIIWFNLHARLATSLQSETRGGTANRAAQRLRHVFIVVQIALAFVLLSSAGLLGLSLRRVLAASAGFTTDNVLTGQILLPWKSYPDSATRLAFAERLLPALHALPGVTQAALSTGLPFTYSTNDSAIAVEGRKIEPGAALKAHYISRVSAEYWAALQIPLLRGRLLDDSDSRREALVCVVDQAFAERYWPGADPLGRRIAQDIEVTEKNAATIVGVVGNVKQSELTENAGHGAVYFPHSGQSYFSVLLHTAIPPDSLIPAARKAVLALDPGLPVYDLRSLQSRIDDSLVGRRSPTILAGLFAGVALLLSAIGTYGVLAYAVSQRRREIGVRMALGALPQQILAQFLGLGARLLGVGLALGLLGSWLAGLAMEHVLFGVESMNIAILAATSGLLFGVVFLALFVPARRAARTDPLVALRAE